MKQKVVYSKPKMFSLSGGVKVKIHGGRVLSDIVLDVFPGYIVLGNRAMVFL